MVHNLTSNEQSKKHVLAMGRIRSELGKKENEIWLFYRLYSYFVDLHEFTYEVVFVKKLLAFINEEVLVSKRKEIIVSFMQSSYKFV